MLGSSKLERLPARLAALAALAAAFALSTVNFAAAAGTPSASIYSLSPGPKTQTTSDRIHKIVSYTFTVVNGNSRRVLLRRIGQNVPGLELLVPNGSGTKQNLIPPSGPGKTHVIRAHMSITLTVWYRVSDCANVPKGPWPLAMDVAWSSEKWQRVALQLPSASVPWPKSLTSFVCS